MKRAAIGLLTGALLLGSVSPVCAAPLNDESVQDMAWRKVFQEPLQTLSGNVQGLCSTEDYIIMIENVADSSEFNDVVTAYYKNDHDADGNPVEQYSVARRVQEREWEHGNGMAYNPNTGEIYVALYTNTLDENIGSLYVMDPETLSYKRTIKVADGYNILGIAYLEEQDQYLIQTNIEADYSFKLLDSDFNIIEDYGPADISPGANTQDMCVVEDYIINSPCGGGELANIYSISGNYKVASVPVELEEDDCESFEIESFTELEPGHLLLTARKSSTDGWKYACFYETYLPVETPLEKAERLEAERKEQEAILEAEKRENALPEAMSAAALLLTRIQEDTLAYEKEIAEAEIQSTENAMFIQKVSSVKVIIPVLLAILLLGGGGIAAYAYHVQLERERRRRIRDRRRAVMELRLRDEMEAYAM